MTSQHSNRGAALVVALLLLLILTLLASAGIGTSTAELIMAGNEQYRRQASDAASAGIERAIARVAADPARRTSSSLSAGFAEADEAPRGKYVTETHFIGDERNLPGWSAEKFIGAHFEIESTGRSARQAVDEQVQGLRVVQPIHGVVTHQRLAGGLEGGSR